MAYRKLIEITEMVETIEMHDQGLADTLAISVDSELQNIIKEGEKDINPENSYHWMKYSHEESQKTIFWSNFPILFSKLSKSSFVGASSSSRASCKPILSIRFVSYLQHFLSDWLDPLLGYLPFCQPCGFRSTIPLS